MTKTQMKTKIKARFLLEIGQLGVAQRGYSYVRPAQATTYTLQWAQAALCDDLDALAAYFRDNYGNTLGMQGRIFDTAAASGGEPVWESLIERAQ